MDFFHFDMLLLNFINTNLDAIVPNILKTNCFIKFVWMIMKAFLITIMKTNYFINFN